MHRTTEDANDILVRVCLGFLRVFSGDRGNNPGNLRLSGHCSRPRVPCDRKPRSYYPDKLVRFPVLFARIADGVNPQQAYHEAEKSTARVAPAVSAMRQATVGMEAAP